MRSITADILSILPFGLQCRAGFHGDVLRVIVVYDILDGNRQFILRADVLSIIVVIDGNKPNAQLGADTFQEIAGFDIVSAQAG